MHANEESGAENGALGALEKPFPPDLAAVVAAWPTLPERTRREICKLLNQARCDALGNDCPCGA